jgi:hypothetical protein
LFGRESLEYSFRVFGDSLSDHRRGRQRKVLIPGLHQEIRGSAANQIRKA